MSESTPSGGPLDELSVFVAEHLPESVVEIVEAVHDLHASPVDVAYEHIHEANALDAQMIEALSHGDVDGASALVAEANATLQAGIDQLPTNHHDG